MSPRTSAGHADIFFPSDFPAVMDPEITAAEERVWSQIRELGIECERMECDPSLADTAQFCAHYGVALADSANAIVVAAKKTPRRYVACLLLADSRLDVNHAVCRLLGTRRASFASAEETRELTGQLIGGVSVFGLPESLPLYIDARVMTRSRVIVGGGSRSSKIRIAPAELGKLPNAQIIEGLALVREAS